jgi:hypothetical protein
MGVPGDTPIFSLHEKTGELRTAASLAPFADGMFTLVIAANNSNEDERTSNTTVKVNLFIIYLLNFIFLNPIYVFFFIVWILLLNLALQIYLKTSYIFFVIPCNVYM